MIAAVPDIAPRRLVPHSPDAERQIIGGILLHPTCRAHVAGTVDSADFFHPAHEAIYAAIVDLDARSLPVDEVTVWARLEASGAAGKLRGVNGAAYFADLTASVVTVENIAYHAAQVRSLAVLRRLAEGLQSAVGACYELGATPEAAMAVAEQYLAAAALASASQKPVGLRQALLESADRIEYRFEHKGAVTGVPTGFRVFDQLTSGFQPGELIIGAARPSVGKSAWAMAVAESAAAAGVAVLFVSLEMARAALTDRHIASSSRVDATRIRTGYLDGHDFARMVRARSESAALPIWIDDERGQTVGKICGKVRRWRLSVAPVEAHPLALVIVDYLQLIAATDEREEMRHRIGRSTKALRNLGGALKLPVLALAQLNRELEKRGDKRPMLSDLKESGNIEEDADTVAFIHRPAMYAAPDTNPDPRVAELIIGKARSGGLGVVRMRWDGQYTRFSDVEE